MCPRLGVKQYRGKQGDPSGGSEIPKQGGQLLGSAHCTNAILGEGKGASPAAWERQAGTVSGVITQMPRDWEESGLRAQTQVPPGTRQ